MVLLRVAKPYFLWLVSKQMAYLDRAIKGDEKMRAQRETRLFTEFNQGEQGYLNLLSHILEKGTRKGDRTGTGTLSVSGPQLTFDLSQGFPLLTTKKMFFRGILYELAWLVSGATNIRFLRENSVNIWNEWAREDGELGAKPGQTNRGMYPEMWRSWPGQNGSIIDQIAKMVEKIQKNPTDRRILVVAYNPTYADEAALPPCHSFFQVVTQDNQIDLILHQRSADMFLGVPFNIASYSLLVFLLAHVTGMQPGHFIHNFGDAHVYLNHIQQVREQIGRQIIHSPPLLAISDQLTSLDVLAEIARSERKLGAHDLKPEDLVKLVGYESQGAIKASVSV